MDKKYDLAVYIGRFQPVHNGHEYVIKEASNIAKEVLILVGSANASISIKNPFTFAEREHLITMLSSKAMVEPLDDYTYEENQWITEVQDLVSSYKAKKVCLIGHTKDETSKYLTYFPQWDFVNVAYHETIDATAIRGFLYNNNLVYAKGALHANTYRELSLFTQTEVYRNLVKEYNYIAEYNKSWSNSPFPPTFNTVDAVVIQSGHILLVQRKFSPGKDLWAMPGGFIDATETQVNAVIRELREETRIKVPEPVLRGSIVKEKTFSNPSRSSRGRTFTQAYLIQLDDSQELPKIKGSDDAKKAEWIPLSKFYSMPELMFEDHYHIVRKLIDNQ